MTKKQKILLGLLLSTPFAIYFVWGIMHLEFEGGTEINFGIFTLSNGLGDILAWLLILILPLILVVIFIVTSTKFRWIKRVVLPIIVGGVIVGLNMTIFVDIFRARSRPNPVPCMTVEVDGKLTQACPSVH